MSRDEIAVKITIHARGRILQKSELNFKEITQVYRHSNPMPTADMQRLGIGTERQGDPRIRICTRNGPHIFIAQIKPREHRIVTYINLNNNPGRVALHPSNTIPGGEIKCG